jgi:hypothetical protein
VNEYKRAVPIESVLIDGGIRQALKDVSDIDSGKFRELDGVGRIKSWIAECRAA